MEIGKELSKQELMNILDLFSPSEYQAICDIFRIIYEAKAKTTDINKLVTVEEAKAEKERFLHRKKELDCIKKSIPDLEVSKYLYGVTFEELPFSEAVVFHINKLIKYGSRLKPQDLIIFRSTIAMFNEHMQSIDQDNITISSYSQLLNQDIIAKMLYVEKKKKQVCEYIIDTYGNSLRSKELGFTFSQYFNPEKELSSPYSKMASRFNCYMGKYTTLDKLEHDDYSDVKKLMYIR